MKVKEARTIGIDTSKAFNDEFKTYRDQLTKPYLSDNETLQKLVKEGYERMNWELRASHILIRVDEDADPAAVQKAEELSRLGENREVYGKMKEHLYGENAAINGVHGPAYMLRNAALFH